MARTIWNRTLLLIAVIGLVTYSGATAQETGFGSITGKVLDPGGNALPGAAVSVVGTTLTSNSDTTGRFRLAPVPAGTVTVTASYLGFDTDTTELEVAAGQTTRHDVTLEASFAEEVTVSTTGIASSTEKALNQQKMAINIQNIVAADQIGRFPDPNAAEATQRIPGITLQRDQGEGRFVQVRGTESRLNSMMINGERLPAPEGAGRNIALDVIPADLLEAIQVSKALTPDMDGDAIGGTVNLVTKRAPEQRRISGTLGYGRNSLTEKDINQANFSYGERYGDDKATGFVISSSYLETDRGSDNIEPEYDDGDLEELQYRDYVINRRRIGFTSSLDRDLSDRSKVYLRAIFNDFDDQEFRRRTRNKVGDDEVERTIKDRLQAQEINNIVFGGERIFGTKILEFRVSTSHSEEAEPFRHDSSFVQEDVEFVTNVSPGQIDPNNIRADPTNEDVNAFILDEVEVTDGFTEEDDLVAAVDLSLPFYKESGVSGLWKFGAKMRFKEKTRNEDLVVFEADDDLFMTSILSNFASDTPFFNGQYDVGPFASPSGIRDLVASGQLESEVDPEADLADYQTDEDTVAAYAMTEVQLGSKTTLLGGLRYETTETSYVANELILDDEGDFESLLPVSSSNDYSELLPMFHLRRALDDDSNFRVAVTRTLARPNFEDLAPFQLILREDDEIERGNPDLKVTSSWNLDLLYEKYFSPAGVLSAGFFYKDLADTVFISSSDEDRSGTQFEVTAPRNADSATLMGLEFAFQRTRLWKGFGIYANFTFTDSETDFPDRQNTRLQGQADNTGNLAFSYEKGGFSSRISANYHSEFLLETGGDPAEDIFVDEHLQIDLSAQYRFGDRLSLFAEVINLNEEEFKAYEGTPDRPRQVELYEWWATFGVKIDM